MAVVLRLFAGIVKGAVVGGLLGVAALALGFGVASPLVASLLAALAAALVAPIAGKKLWEKDGWIQVALKALAGLLLGPGLMWLARRFLVVPLPDVTGLPGLGALPGIEALRGAPLTLGSFSVTALAIVAAALAGFYDLDHTESGSAEAKGGTGSAPKAGAKPAAKAARRIDPELAALTGLDPAELAAAEDDAAERARKG